jgi:hypothetical protein
VAPHQPGDADERHVAADDRQHGNQDGCASARMLPRMPLGAPLQFALPASTPGQRRSASCRQASSRARWRRTRRHRCWRHGAWCARSTIWSTLSRRDLPIRRHQVERLVPPIPDGGALRRAVVCRSEGLHCLRARTTCLELASRGDSRTSTAGIRENVETIMNVENMLTRRRSPLIL